MPMPQTAAVRLLAGDKEPVRVASTANLALSGLGTVDGVALVAGDRVLVKDQADATQNGVYTASVGTWRRAGDSSSSRMLVAGMKVAVQEGTAHGGNVWSLITNRPDIGDDDIEWEFYLSADMVTQIANAANDIIGTIYALTNAADFASKAAAAVLSLPSGMTYLRTAGYAALGDGGGALYKKVISEPSHTGKFQSADGAWWEVVNVATMTFDTATALAASPAVDSSQTIVRTRGKLAVGDMGGATYMQVASDPGIPGSFALASGRWVKLIEPVVTPQMFKLSTDGSNDALMLTRFFAFVNEQSQFGAGYGGLGVIPGGITYNLATTVPIAVCDYRRTKVSAAGAVFKTTGAIFAFTITGGGYSGGITLEDFCVNQQASTSAQGAFNLKGTGGVHLVRPHVIGGQTTNTSYVGINLTLSNAADPSTGCLWTQIDKPQIYSFTADQVPTGVYMEGSANETRILGGHFGTCTRGVWIDPAGSPYYFPNSVKIRDVSFERCTYGVYCKGVIGNANTKPEGLKVTGCRFELMSQAAVAFVNMDQTASNLPEFHENFYTGTLTYLYNPNGIGISSSDFPKDVAGTAAFSSNTAKDVTFVFTQSSANFVVAIDAPANQPFWITNKGTTGFRINTTPAFTGSVGWSVTRLA